MTISSFQVNCPLPDKITNYVSGPDTRGTLNILWSSLSVLLLCTWSIQHLNVPPQFCPLARKTHKQQWWRFRSADHQGLNRKLYLFHRRVKWLVLNFIMPELILGLALSDWISARKYSPELERWAQNDEVEWSLGHTYFANMGGFLIHFGKGLEDNSSLSGRTDVEENSVQRLNNDLVAREDIEVDLHSSCRDSSETSFTTLRNEPEIAVTRDDSLQSSLPSEDDSPRTIPVNVGERMAAAVRLRREDDGREISLPANMAISTSSKIDHDITTHIQRYWNDPRWGNSQYAKRILSWQTYLGFDWQFDIHNQKVVQRALQSCSTADLQETPLLQWYFNIRMLQGSVWYVDAPQLLLARDMGLIRRLPVLSTAQLGDQSKDSFLVRTITLVQVLWLVIEMIVRHTQGLPVTQLEVVVLAFSACSFFTYLLLWHKPQDAQTAIRTTAAHYPDVSEVKSLAAAAPKYFGLHRQMPFMAGSTIHSCGKMEYGFPAGLLLGTSLFGGLHCLSWNSHFSSSTERTLWRVSSLIVTAGPLAIILTRSSIAAVLVKLPHIALKWRAAILTCFFNICFLTYFAARMYLIVEMLYALAFSPPNAFLATDWSRYLPHLG